MTLRLVLVGVVASLGLTLPSRSALESWTRSGQAWLNARLAEWEAQRPVEEGSFVFVAETIATPSASDEATPSTSAAVEHIAATAKLVEAPAPLPAWFEARLDDWSAANVIDPARFVVRTEAILIVPKKTEDTQALDRAFNVVVDEMVASFSQDIAAAHSPEVSQTARIELPEVVEDPYQAFAFALNREAEGLSEPVPVAMAERDPAPAADDFPTPESRLADAIRLTREAVNAWASVLHGPAVVTITH